MSKPIRETPRFLRNYKSRIATDKELQKNFTSAIATFLDDPVLVDDHPLEAKMAGLRSFSITEEYRIVYRETDEYYLFQDVGDHEQVYLR